MNILIRMNKEHDFDEYMKQMMMRWWWIAIGNGGSYFCLIICMCCNILFFPDCWMWTSIVSHHWQTGDLPDQAYNFLTVHIIFYLLQWPKFLLFLAILVLSQALTTFSILCTHFSHSTAPPSLSLTLLGPNGSKCDENKGGLASFWGRIVVNLPRPSVQTSPRSFLTFQLATAEVVVEFTAASETIW